YRPLPVDLSSPLLCSLARKGYGMVCVAWFVLYIHGRCCLLAGSWSYLCLSHVHARLSILNSDPSILSFVCLLDPSARRRKQARNVRTRRVVVALCSLDWVGQAWTGRCVAALGSPEPDDDKQAIGGSC
uniref:Uncharacterized protein n=1 Tax=Aegilops tauschii subsp. strangulata TaxID=200361 RepID=A0A453LL61_AEGTS